MDFKSFTGIALAAMLSTQSFAQTCNNPEGVHSAQAALAVALAKETGRLQPLTDLVVVGERLEVSDAGRAACLENIGTNSCPNVRAILELQDPAITQYIPIEVFHPVIFSQRLVIHYQRQEIAAGRPDHDANRAYAEPHTLEQVGLATPDSSCGPHYLFDVDLLSGADYPDLSDFCGQLIFAGSQGTFNNGVCDATNPYLDFTIHSTSPAVFSIDPSADVGNFTEEVIPEGDTINSCFFVDVTKTSIGNSCVCDGVGGTLAQSPTDENLMYCQ